MRYHHAVVVNFLYITEHTNIALLYSDCRSAGYSVVVSCGRRLGWKAIVHLWDSLGFNTDKL